MPGLILRQPIEADISYLAEHMRDVDKAELLVTYGQQPEEAIRASLKRTEPYYQLTAEYDGQILCMCGCASMSLVSPVGVPWLLCTDAMSKHIKRLTFHPKPWLAVMLDRWPLLTNVIDVRNRDTMRWLALLGFEFTDAPAFVPGYPLRRFTMHRLEAAVYRTNQV